MCHFITATIPASTQVDELNKLGENHALRFSVIHNQFVEDQLPKGIIYLAKASPRCDCGTVLGSLSNANPYPEQDHAQIEKLRRKGWSQAKIDRWLDEKLGYQEKLEREKLALVEHRSPEAADWLAFLKDVVMCDAIGQFGLLLHFYRRGPATEKILLKGIQRISLKQVDHQYLMAMKEDVLYLFVQ